MDTKTVSDMVTACSYLLMEDGSLSSGLWDLNDVLDAINWAETSFLEDTGVLKARTELASEIGVRLYAEPATSLAMDRITYDRLPLYRTTEELLTRGNPKWQSLVGKPEQYHQDQLETHKFETDRRPSAIGAFHIVHTLAPTAVTGVDSVLNVPACFFHILKWRVLERLLSMPGEQRDPVRAQYCQTRYATALPLVKTLMGSEDNARRT